jgi:hypothetical protein
MSTHHPSRHRKARGAALVETALGATLMVTIIIFGIHFAEVGYLSLKVQEAAISALWNGTHRRMHAIPFDYEQAEDAMEAAAGDAQRRYADFNGLSRINRAPGITQAFTTGRNMRVTCEQGGAPDWDGTFLTRLMYRDRGAARCGAEADLSAFRLPRRFLDENDSESALYKEQHADERFTNIRVCATGRAVSGQCQGTFNMLVDDWGLAGGFPSEVLTCQMPLGHTPYDMFSLPTIIPIPCLNLPYYSAVFGTYLPTAIIIPWMSDQMPLTVFQFPAPIHSRYFFMSAPGEELLFSQIPTLDQWRGSGLFPTTPGAPYAITSGTYGFSWAQRLANGRCFLGRDCD